MSARDIITSIHSTIIIDLEGNLSRQISKPLRIGFDADLRSHMHCVMA